MIQLRQYSEKKESFYLYVLLGVVFLKRMQVSASPIWNYSYNFGPKLYDAKINCHLIISNLKSHNLSF